MAATVIAYSSAIRAPFEYDDLPAIQQNTTIRQILPLTVPLNPPPQLPVSGRPAVNLSLAVNYAINEWLGVDQRADPAGPSKTVGYHIVNVLFHLVCGILLFGAIRRTVAGFTNGVGVQPESVAGFATLLWLLHPIQTEAVDYLIQRTELMVSVCYTATLYASIRAWDAISRSTRLWWYALAIVVCLVGMASKEVMVTAPVMVVLYDRAFRASSWKEVLRDRDRLRFYGALFATAFIVVASVLTGARSQSVGFDLGVTWYQYLYTQAWAITRYLRLIVWPAGLTFDYGEAPITGARGVPGVLLLSACAIATIVAWTRPRWLWLGFLGAWFFLLLAPSSSVVPIKTEIAAERRIYLASAAVFILLVLGVERLRQRIGFRPVLARIGFGIVAGILAVVTFGRGLTYASPESLYRDTIAKQPTNPRAFVGLGLAVLQQGPDHFEDAAAHFRRAIAIDSTNIVAWRSLALLESLRGNWRQAAVAYERVLRNKPDNLDANDGMARALLRLDQPDAAMPYVKKVGIADLELLWTLGDQLVQRGRGAEALPYLEAAAGQGVPPSLGLALLSVAYAQSGRVDDAVTAAAVATSTAADTVGVFEMAARAMVAAKRPTEARLYLQHALAINPSSASARQALADLNRVPPR